MKKETYLKQLIEENKRLKDDLEIICCGSPVKSILKRIQWRAKLKNEKILDAVIKKVLHNE